MEFSEDFANRWQAELDFDRILAVKGEIFRQVERRRTVRFRVRDKDYFIKIHLGVGWKEIFKNLCRFRMPVLGAKNEYTAIHKIGQLKVETMTLAGYGNRGFNPAQRESFVITESLENTISLQDFCADWRNSPPDLKLKRALIGRVARIVRRLHDNGVNHRDLYICHFLLKLNAEGGAPSSNSFHLYLIDLHRVQIRETTPKRWIIKDLSALLFSSMNIGLSRRDLLRFLRIYGASPLREQLRQKKRLLTEVQKKAIALNAPPIKG